MTQLVSVPRKTLVSPLVLLWLVLPSCGGRASSTTAAPAQVPGQADGGAPAAPAVDDDVLAAFIGPDAYVVTHDGVSHALLAGQPSFAGLSAEALANNGYLFLEAWAPNVTLPRQQAVIGADGSTFWQATLPLTSAQQLASMNLGVDGTLAYRDATGSSLVQTDGSSVHLEGYGPLGPPTADHHLFVGGPVENATTTTLFGWWRMGEATVRPITATPALSSWPSLIGGRLVYVTADAPPALVVDAPYATQRITLPSALATGAWLGDNDGARWVLLQGGDPAVDRVWRVDLLSSSIEEIDYTLPSGLRPFNACTDGRVGKIAARIDHEGRLLAALRTDDHMALHATTDGKTWTSIGESVTGNASFGVRVEGGTYVIEATTDVECYTPGPTWAHSTSAYLGPNATQLVRPGDGASFVATGTPQTHAVGAASFSSSGRYAAYWEDGSISGTMHVLHVIDVVTGTDVVALRDGAPATVDPALWVAPRPGAK